MVEKVLRQPMPSIAAANRHCGSVERKLKISGGPNAKSANPARRPGILSVSRLGSDGCLWFVQSAATAVEKNTKPRRILSSGAASRIQFSHDCLTMGLFPIGSSDMESLPDAPASRPARDEPAKEMWGVEIITMGNVATRWERKRSYFLRFSRCSMPIRAMRPTIMPIKKPMTAMIFVPNH